MNNRFLKRPPPRGLGEAPLPADLMQKRISSYVGPAGGSGMSRDEMIQRIMENSDIVTMLNVLQQAFIARPIQVGTTPVLIVDGTKANAYIFQNPTPAMSLTGTGTILASAARLVGSGNTQASPIGVASFLNMSLFLNITTAGAQTVTIDALTQDPLSLGWATSQAAVFNLVTGVGTYYANLGSLGVDQSFAVKWTVAGGTATFSLSYVLKNGLPGGTTGLANAIYLGGPQVNSTTGFPLLEGHSITEYLYQNVKLYAVSNVASPGVTLNIFELQ